MRNATTDDLRDLHEYLMELADRARRARRTRHAGNLERWTRALAEARVNLEEQ